MFPFDHRYPGTDLHEIDLAYILQQIRILRETMANFVELNRITFADPIGWDISKNYPAAQIVKDPNTGVLYLSKQPVPDGIAITNTDYWLEIGNMNYTAQFFKDAICAYDEGDSLTSANDYLTGDYLWWGDKLYKVIADITTGDALTVGTNIEEVTVTDELKRPIPRQGSDPDMITFTRLYWEDSGNYQAPDNTYLRQIEAIGVDDNTIYLAAHNNTYSRLTMIDRTTFAESNVYYSGVVIGCMALDPVANRIYYSDNGTASYIDLSTYAEYPMTGITDTIQSFGYDEVTGKLYCKGLSNYDTFYEVTESGGVFTNTQVCQIPNYLQSGVLQDMTVHDGMIYWTQSNPNIIYKYDVNTGDLVHVYNLNYRMDKILPVGELEAITFHNGMCYIAGYNRSMVSGKPYINVIGEYNFQLGEPTKSVDYRQYPQVLYVDPQWPYTGGQKYVATGWISSYYPKPFTTMWEAIEAATGLHAFTGVRCQISVNSAGNTFEVSRIPGDCITQIDGNAYDGSTYQYILTPTLNGSIYIENGNLTMARALFKANGSQSEIVVVRRCMFSLQNCAVLDPYTTSKSSVFRIMQGSVFSNISDLQQGNLDAAFSAETIKTDYKTNNQFFAWSDGGLIDVKTTIPERLLRVNDSGSGIVAGNSYIHYVMQATDTANTNIVVGYMPNLKSRPCITVRYNELVFQYAGTGSQFTSLQTNGTRQLYLSITASDIVRVRSNTVSPGDVVDFVA